MLSGFRLLRLMAITMKIKMIAAAITIANTRYDDGAGGVGVGDVVGAVNCIVTW